MFAYVSLKWIKKPNSTRNNGWKPVVWRYRKRSRSYLLEWILLINYLEKVKTITGEYYSNLFYHLDVIIRKQKCFGKGKTTGFRVRFARPPCSPDLVLSNFYIFPHSKAFVSRKRFASNEKVGRAVDEYLNNLSDSHFHKGILMLKKAALYNQLISDFLGVVLTK